MNNNHMLADLKINLKVIENQNFKKLFLKFLFEENKNHQKSNN